MIILSAKNITKEYGTDVILKDISFHVNKGDRVGIIGANGAGKTTLLKILTGESEASSGDFFVAGDTTIGYLKQTDDFGEEGTVIGAVEKIFKHLAEKEQEMLRLSEAAAEATGEEAEKLLHKYDKLHQEFQQENGYAYKSEIRGVLTSMVFSEDMYENDVATLSGGEKTRLSLACLLLKKPDLLFLDEPTNHLDIGTLKWLEQYLKAYKGTIIVVSHDRYFLNETVNKIFEVENHKLYRYEGNYKAFAEKKRLRREEELRQYNAQQREIEKQEEIVRRFKGHGTEKLAKRAASREKKLEKIQRIDRPEESRGKMKIHFKERFESGKDVIFSENLAKSFGYGRNKTDLFENVDLDIKRGERICIVGPNGVGKTTLMRIIMGELDPNEGYVKLGHNVEFGYYDQEQKLLNENNTVLEELKESYRLYSDTEMRSILGRFLFQNEMVFLPVSALSGGEKARLSLVKLMLSGSNVLIMDEPTNHLDIDSKEVFEEALMDFPGTLIVVSHDRYFLNKIPTRIMELSHEGITPYLGQYDYYVEKKQQIQSGQSYLDELSGRSKGGKSNLKAGETGRLLNDRAGNNSSYGSGNSGAGSSGNGDSGSSANSGVGGNGGLRNGGNFQEQSGPLGSAEERKRKKAEEAEERRQKRQREQAEKEIEETERKIENMQQEMCKEEVLEDYAKLAKMNEELEILNQNLLDLYEKWLQ